MIRLSKNSLSKPLKLKNVKRYKTMTRSLLTLPVMLLAISTNSFAAESDSKYFSSASFMEIDWNNKESNDNYSFDGQWLYGSDYNKLAILTEGELFNDELEEAEVQLLYSKYLATFWDARFGLRQELKPESETSLVVGIEGLAPYLFDVGSSLYLSEKGNASAEVELAYEVQLTQNLVAEIYSNATLNGYNDAEDNKGSGLAMADYGMQIRYEFNRHFALYLDVNEAKTFGETKRMLREANESSDENRLSFGIRFFNF